MVNADEYHRGIAYSVEGIGYCVDRGLSNREEKEEIKTIEEMVNC